MVASSTSPSPHFDITELAPGVWGALATRSGFALCNAGIIDLGDATVVFDAMLTPMAGADLARAAERLTGRRPGFVVNSHWHGDHMRGTSAFAPVQVVSSRGTRELIAERSLPAFLEDRSTIDVEIADLEAGRIGRSEADRLVYGGWLRGVAATPAALQIVVPNVTFDTELTLHGSRRALRLYCYAGGHSPSDVVAVLPDQRLGFTGDLATFGFQPWTTDGSATKYLAALEQIRSFDLERVLPGHGPPGGPSDLAAVETYIRLVLSTAAQPADPASDATLPAPRPYSDWIFADQFARNVAHERGLAARAADGPA